MPNPSITPSPITSFESFSQCADYSLLSNLNVDPDADAQGNNRYPREVYSGHFVPVAPTPLAIPEYIAHSHSLFEELGLSPEILEDEQFIKMFSGDLSATKHSTVNYGWATGYALSIMGTEYTQQCPFRTGNGYGDGRAISVFEGVFSGNRWEFQLKGSGPTPYCRGGDGRAVLRSSVREFLAQEHMHALGVPTSRSLTLYVSQSETVQRPWYTGHNASYEPDVMVENPVAISTRVAPSFLRVGQLELFARRARNGSDPQALEELQMIVLHAIEREYKDEIETHLPLAEQLEKFAECYSKRLISLVCHWLRVGYCQGNFNSDNCAIGGYTLDYGPFGFCEIFDTGFQPWTGGGEHYNFFNQAYAAEANFHMFWAALRVLVADNSLAIKALDRIRAAFPRNMQTQLHSMWASKLGLASFDEPLFSKFLELSSKTALDFTIFFRELSKLPTSIEALAPCFYHPLSTEHKALWGDWLNHWWRLINAQKDLIEVSQSMLQINPKYTWREWLVVPAYEQAARGDYELLNELQTVLSKPYDEQSTQIEDKFYRLRPEQFFNKGGISHYSCSS